MIACCKFKWLTGNARQEINDSCLVRRRAAKAMQRLLLAHSSSSNNNNNNNTSIITTTTTNSKSSMRIERHPRKSAANCLKMLLNKVAGMLLVPLLLAAFWANQCEPSLALIQVPNRHTVASIPGDLVLGILVPVHERPSPKQAQTRTCGSVREQYGIQRVEAAFRTIDSINADPTILPNITLGIEIRDSCWHSPIALEQSIEFIRDAMAASEQTQAKLAASLSAAISSGNPFHLSPGAAASVGETSGASVGAGNAATNSICAPLLMRQIQQQQQTQSKKVKNIVGVVGPASSTDTVQVQNLLQLFNMPQVGYSATSRDLSNKNFFKYFLRVVPSDKLQAQVMIDLMLAHNWTYITVAYTEGSYGSSLMNAFRERAQEVGICFATLESMPPNADDAKFDELIEAIQKHPNARVVICMCEGRTVGKLFAGFKRKNITNEYLVVGSDGWSDRFDVVEKQEEYALGGISIRIHSAYVNDFDDYYFSLNPFTNHRNPWFAEFWETRFLCNLELNSAKINTPPTNANRASSLQTSGQQQQRPFVRPPGAKVYNRTCTGRESLRNNHKQDAKMAFVQKSIITMALGLDSMQRAICQPNKPGLCPEMLPVNGSILLQHLMNVSFSFLDEEVYFDEQGDPPGKYEILNFQRRRPVYASTESQFGLEPDSTLPRPLPSAANALFGSDYSIATVAGNISESTLAEKKRLNPLYDSYTTLKVYRQNTLNSNNSPADDEPTNSGNKNGKGRFRRVQPPEGVAREQHGSAPPASGYSSTSGYEYVHVGSWKSSDGLSLFGDIHWPLRSFTDEVNFGGGVPGPTLDSSSTYSRHQPPQQNLDENTLPKSVCSLPCAKGHAKKIQSDSVKCCWVCVPCRPHEYLFNEFKCKACEKGWWPNSIQTGCEQIPIQYLDWRSMEALTAISIAIIGLALTLATAVVFIKHNETPVVKSSTRELSYMILFAMFLCYMNTFFLVAKPRKETCFMTRILPGFAFAMMYGALVTKTNRIARILAGSKKKIITRRPRFMSATSQVAITWVIVLIECLIIVFMLIKEPADKMHDYPSADQVVLVCNTTTLGIIAPLGFDFFLIAMCTLYAFKTRNVPENFNEAKFIGFTMYTTLVIWIALIAIYLSSDHKVTTLCLCISFSALFALSLLFFPKCYIIIFKPEKNNRGHFTTTKNVRCHIGYQIGSAGAAAAAAAAAHHGANQATGHHTNGSNTSTTNNNNNNNTINNYYAPCCTTGTNSNSLENEQYEPQYHYQQQAPPRQGSRSRTSGLHWREHPRPATQTGDPLHAGHNLVSGCGDTVGVPATSIKCRQLEGLTTCRPGLHSVASFEQQTTNLSFGEKQHHHQAPTSSQPIGQDLQGMQQQSQLLPRQQHIHLPALRPLFDGLLSIFSHRSRRKESDKATSIQQHLRAVRHAENLDRQTHFRRSQVQRLVQRFDSTGGNFQLEQGNWSTSKSSQHSAANLSSMANFSRSFEFSMANKNEDSERLLMVLSQLIGIQNVCRLADALKRYCQATTPNNNNINSNIATQRHELILAVEHNTDEKQVPLDLDKLANRKLALTLLRFLAEVVEKSMREIRKRGRSQSSLSQDSLDLASREFDLGALESVTVDDGHSAEWSVLTQETSTNVLGKLSHYKYELLNSLSSKLELEKQVNGAKLISGKTTSSQTKQMAETGRVFSDDHDDGGGDYNDGSNDSKNRDKKNNGDNNNLSHKNQAGHKRESIIKTLHSDVKICDKECSPDQAHDDEDPIKRVLDSIMGTGSCLMAARPTKSWTKEREQYHAGQTEKLDMPHTSISDNTNTISKHQRRHRHRSHHSVGISSKLDVCCRRADYCNELGQIGLSCNLPTAVGLPFVEYGAEQMLASASNYQAVKINKHILPNNTDPMEAKYMNYDRQVVMASDSHRMPLSHSTIGTQLGSNNQVNTFAGQSISPKKMGQISSCGSQMLNWPLTSETPSVIMNPCPKNSSSTYSQPVMQPINLAEKSLNSSNKQQQIGQEHKHNHCRPRSSKISTGNTSRLSLEENTEPMGFYCCRKPECYGQLVGYRAHRRHRSGCGRRSRSGTRDPGRGRHRSSDDMSTGAQIKPCNLSRSCGDYQRLSPSKNVSPEQVEAKL